MFSQSKRLTLAFSIEAEYFLIASID